LDKSNGKYEKTYHIFKKGKSLKEKYSYLLNSVVNSSDQTTSAEDKLEL
jgi:hypothetical protein